MVDGVKKQRRERMSKASNYVEKWADAEKIKPIFPFKPQIMDVDLDCCYHAQVEPDGGICIYEQEKPDECIYLSHKESIHLAQWIFKIYQDE
jgi:hypothetical protein